MRGKEERMRGWRRAPPCQRTVLLFLGAVNGAVIVQLWAAYVRTYWPSSVAGAWGGTPVTLAFRATELQRFPPRREQDRAAFTARHVPSRWNMSPCGDSFIQHWKHCSDPERLIKSHVNVHNWRQASKPEETGRRSLCSLAFSLKVRWKNGC